MKRLIFCEKSKQGQAVAAYLGASAAAISLGRSRSYVDVGNGDFVAWAQGHIEELAPPAVYVGADPKTQPYAHWSWDRLPLLPDQLRVVRSEEWVGTIKAFKGLLADLAKAGGELVAATDNDDEGELIWRSVMIDDLGWRGKTRRMIYQNTTLRDLDQGFANLQDPDAHRLRAEAAAARRDGDWLIGMNCSPAACLALIPDGIRHVTFAIGRGKTAALRMVEDRRDAIAGFKEEIFYSVVMMATTAKGDLALEHRPAGEARIFDRAVAQTIADQAATWAGPLRVRTARKKKPPPKPCSRNDLNVAAARQLRMSLAQTEQELQSLYEANFVTYPRTAGQTLQEDMIADVPRQMEHARLLGDAIPGLARLIPAEPIIRRGKAGTFNDAAVADAGHHAIIPHVETAPQLGGMTAHQKALYLLIWRRYLQQFLPDYQYDSTVVTARVGQADFRAEGQITVDLGWRLVDANPDGDPDDVEDRALPPVTDGLAAQSGGATLTANKTTPPRPMTEADLVEDMEHQAHKYVQHPALAEMLKAAKGIGTSATRQVMVNELYEHGLLAKAKDGTVWPTEGGTALIQALKRYAPQVCDPGLSALFEEQADRIRKGTMTRDQHWQLIRQLVSEQVASLKTAPKLPLAAFGAALAAKAAEWGKRGADQMEYARAIARVLKVPLPPDAATSISACSAYIDEHKEAYALKRPPSEGQLKFAASMAGTLGIRLPAGASALATACTAWIDQHREAYDAKAPRTSGGGKGEGKAPSGRSATSGGAKGGRASQAAATSAAKALVKGLASRAGSPSRPPRPGKR